MIIAVSILGGLVVVLAGWIYLLRGHVQSWRVRCSNIEAKLTFAKVVAESNASKDLKKIEKLETDCKRYHDTLNEAAQINGNLKAGLRHAVKKLEGHGFKNKDNKLEHCRAFKTLKELADLERG